MTEKIWLKQYPKQIPAEIHYEQVPIHSFLEIAGREVPNKVAIHFLGKELTYGEVAQYAKNFAAYLQSIGITKGDRVAIMLPNSPQAVIAYYGILQAGAIVVQTNPLYTERELAYQLQDSGSKAIVTLPILFPRVSKARTGTDLEHIIVSGVQDFLPFPKNVIYPFIERKQTKVIVDLSKEHNVHHLKDIIKKEGLPLEEHSFDFHNDAALLQYTGGTTGPPKGVILTHENLISNVSMCDAWLYESEKGEETVLGILPFFHVYGMTTVLILSVMMQHKMVLLPKFDVEETLKTIDKQRPTLFPGAPTIYIGILNAKTLPKYDLSSIKACISGSAALPVEVKDQFEKVTGGRLVEGYGLTETSPVTHANLVWGGKRVDGSIGLPWPNTDAILLGPDGKEVEQGQVGEIAIKGPQVMKGYWNREEDTKETFHEGWLLTGDLGYMDEEGFFYVVDRKKDMIIASGFNIYPREVEEVLYEHEAIQECVVVGIPDPYRGETVKAFVVLKEGKTVTEEELNQFARKYLASFKVPRQYEFRAELPKTAVGKILRRVLIDEEKEKMKHA